ncbi:S8 family serine peptidase [Streptomyces sannanensis]|uniref:S8 family serine peptidase n=1 Tax=Streptomyces sannanensis TaxID=285536 RepID=A0ABP6SHV7_9ACTN
MQGIRASGLLSAAVLGALVVGTTLAPPAGAPLPGGVTPAAAATAVGTGRVVKVTLITGDQVTVRVGAGNAVSVMSVRPGPGREDMLFSQRRSGNSVSLVPQDAEGPLRAGLLDARLFDIKGLVAQKYDDAHSDRLPLIVTYDTSVGKNSVPAAPDGARKVRALKSVHGSALRADKKRLSRVWRQLGPAAAAKRKPTAALAPGVAKVWLDGRVKTTLDRSTAQIGAPQAWKSGWTGKGVKVAVLDTGIDATHPDFAGSIGESSDFTEDGGASGSGAPDREGHGTHVASTIAGDGAASGGRLRGVAPDAELLVGKVLNDDGEGQESWVLQGMEWAAARATVVNMSLGSGPSDGTDPLSQAVDSLSAQYGTLFVAAAGNYGGAGTVAAPGTADAALTVGAVGRDDALAYFSSQGPREGGHVVKPDVTAPGVDIVAARAAGTSTGTPAGERYTALSGTSMAAPHVAGAAALLAQEHPDWDGARLKAALMSSAKPVAGQGAYQQGSGRVDVARAISQNVWATAEDTGVYFADPKATTPVTRTVTYHNAGTADVVLTVTAAATDRSGTAAPAGLFTVSPGTVTVPAGGTARATVTVDPGTAAAGTSFSGRLTATAEGGVAVTGPAFAVTKEAVYHQVVVKAVDRNGAPLQPGSRGDYVRSSVSLTNLSTGESFDLTFTDGTATARVPEGRYNLGGYVATPETAGAPRTATMFLQPELDIRQDTERTVDARDGKEISVVVPGSGAQPYSLSAGYCYSAAAGGECADGYLVTGRPGRLFAVPGGQVSHGVLDFVVRNTQNGTTATNGQLPDHYDLLVRTTGSLPDPSFRVAREDLAVIKNVYHAQGPGTAGEAGGYATEDGLGAFSIVEPDFALPAARTEYVTVRGQYREAYFGMGEGTGGEISPKPVTQTGVVTCAAGRTCVDRWNAAVIGPALVPLRGGVPPMGRSSDGTMSVEPQLFSDAAPNHYGTPLPHRQQDTVRITLSRDGQEVGSSDRWPAAAFVVPDDEAAYRLTARATRDEPGASLSTTVETAWTFRSAAVTPGPGGTARTAALPLSVVRFTAPVNVDNEAPRTRHTLVTRVDRQPGAPAAKTERLTVKVSFDDGATWQNAKVSAADGGAYRVTVDPPAGAGPFVSLKATAQDTDGGTVEQTVLRAYRLAS